MPHSHIWRHIVLSCRAQHWQLFHHQTVYLKFSWLTVSLTFCWVGRFCKEFFLIIQHFELPFAVPRGVLFGCGDLIFSSHMIFTLVFVRTYHKYGSKRWWYFTDIFFFFLNEPYKVLTFSQFVIPEPEAELWTFIFRFIKFLAWFMAIFQSLLIIASRKHYSVDVVVAWYANF